MFEKAKFRDLYLTRDNRKAVFIKAHFYSDLDTNLYEFMIEDGTWISVTSDGLVDYETSSKQDDDIISKYQEPIDEAELREKAYEWTSFVKENNIAVKTIALECAMIGYRKAKEGE